MQRTRLSFMFLGALVLSLSAVPTSVAVTSDPAGGGQSHENHQPGLGINYLIATSGEFADRNSGSPTGPDRYLGEITMFAGNFAPLGWAFADGQVLPIATHSPMFSFLGTTYGGDGRTTLALPDLRGRSAMKFGNAPGISNIQIGQKLGVDNVTLSSSQMPSHDHPIAAPFAASLTGGGQSHTNMKPSQAINFFLPNTGGEVRMGGFNFAPNGNFFADGQILNPFSNPGLFNFIGTTYGGNGLTTFALPDLRGRLAMHEGQGTGLTDRTLGSTLGAENVTLTESTMPTHGHGGADPLGDAGGGLAHENMQPTNTLNYIIATQGLFPSNGGGGTTYGPTNSRSPFIGEIRLFAGLTAPAGWEFADGQIVPIPLNSALFSIIGTTYGGDGQFNFALPDLRGRVPVHVGGNQPGAGLRVWTLGEKDGQESVALTLSQLPVHTHDYSLLPGDLNGDGFVGIDDLNLVLANWNQNVPPANPLADPSGDGFVGIDDLNAVLGNWNTGTPPPPGSNNIPEPASLVLLGLGGVAMARRYRVVHV